MANISWRSLNPTVKELNHDINRNYLIEKDIKLGRCLTSSHLLIIPLTSSSVASSEVLQITVSTAATTSLSNRIVIASQNAVLHIRSISPSVIIWKHIFEIIIIILNFNQVLNLDYYDILRSSDKGVITPLSELQKIPQIKTQPVNLYLFIYRF